MEDKTVVIALNGRLRGSKQDYQKLFDEVDDNLYFIAADGGALFLEQLEISPDLIIGDLDSLSKEDINQFRQQKIKINKFPEQKDKTDGELVIDYCQQNKVQDSIIIGATGGRFDQQVGHVSLLEYAHKIGVKTIIKEPGLEMGIIYNNKILNKKKNCILSLIPITEKVRGVEISGCKYNLEGEILYRYRSRGISNYIEQNKAEVKITSGLLLYVCQTEELEL